MVAAQGGPQDPGLPGEKSKFDVVDVQPMQNKLGKRVVLRDDAEFE